MSSLALTLAASIVLIGAVPASAAEAAPRGCANPVVEKKRAEFELELLRCPSDHAGAYSYQARLSHAALNSTVELQYYPRQGLVPDARAKAYSGGVTIYTGWYYGKVGELQPCAEINHGVSWEYVCAWE